MRYNITKVIIPIYSHNKVSTNCKQEDSKQLFRKYISWGGFKNKNVYFSHLYHGKFVSDEHYKNKISNQVSSGLETCL